MAEAEAGEGNASGSSGLTGAVNGEARGDASPSLLPTRIAGTVPYVVDYEGALCFSLYTSCRASLAPQIVRESGSRTYSGTGFESDRETT